MSDRKGVIAVRRHCCAWKCECGHINLTDEIVAGWSNECQACHRHFRIDGILDSDSSQIQWLVTDCSGQYSIPSVDGGR